jgi:L-aminopeptidase/D-esterase-like protein
MSPPRPGPLNLITDVPGLLVGQATDERVQTGVTVALLPGGWTAAVDVRGGGPGEREHAPLGLENLVGQAHAIVLTGGSVYGLAAADGVCAALASRGEGLRLNPEPPTIPIVPAAVLHDLANPGDKAWGMDPPYRRLGIEAVEAAASSFDLGAVGAGRGARAGLVQGGVGSASVDLGDGLIVGALVGANPLGSAYMPDGETFWAWPFEMDREFGGRRPSAASYAHDPVPELARLKRAGRLTPGVNTTIALVAVSAALTGPECKRVAMMAHDGMARAVRPAHTPFDGDTVFAVASGPALPSEERWRIVAQVGSAAADCLARAIARAVWTASHQPA